MRVLWLLLIFISGVAFAQSAEIDEIRYFKIWDRAPHNAFTDLALFKGKLYVTFREGADHASDDGAIRILSSTDTYRFEDNNLFTDPHFDLRDPKILNYNDTLLIVTYCRADRNRKIVQTAIRYSEDGKTWSKEIVYTQQNTWWLWSLCNFKGRLVSAGYNFFNSQFVNLFEFDKKGGNFTKIYHNMFSKYNPSETTLAASPDGDTMFCAIRTMYATPTPMGYCANDSSLRKWEFKEVNYLIMGGPKLFYLKDRGLYLLTRDNTFRTSLFSINTRTFDSKKLFTLPSSGDNGYAAAVQYKGKLFISYYSSHEGKASIYMASINLNYLGELEASNDVPDLNDYSFWINVSPNPVRNRINCKIYSQKEHPDTRVEIFDMSGKLVYTAPFPIRRGIGNTPIDASNFIPGIYILKISDGTSRKTYKIIKAP